MSGSKSYTSLVLASDRTGYALAYADYDYAPYGTIFGGASWSAPNRLTTGTSYRLSIAGRPGEYLFVWIDGPSSYRWVTGSGSTWSWGPATQLASDSGFVRVALADGPSGFAAVYFTNTSIAARIMTSGAFGPVNTLRSSSSCSYYDVASNGTGYLVVTGCSASGQDLQSVAFDGVLWHSPRILRSSAWVMGTTVASDGTGYAVLLDGGTSAGIYSIALPEPIAGAIGAPVRLGLGAADADREPIVGSAAAGFLAAWKQPDPAETSVHRIYARAGL